MPLLIIFNGASIVCLVDYLMIFSELGLLTTALWLSFSGVTSKDLYVRITYSSLNGDAHDDGNDDVP